MQFTKTWFLEWTKHDLNMANMAANMAANMGFRDSKNHTMTGKVGLGKTGMWDGQVCWVRKKPRAWKSCFWSRPLRWNSCQFHGDMDWWGCILLGVSLANQWVTVFAGKQLCSYETWSTVFSHEHRIDISGFVPRSSGQGAFEQVLSGVSDFCHPNFCCFQLPLMFSGSVAVKPIVARDQWLSGYGNRHPRKLIGVVTPHNYCSCRLGGWSYGS